MIHFDALNFSECRSEKVMFHLTLSVVHKALANQCKRPKKQLSQCTLNTASSGGDIPWSELFELEVSSFLTAGKRWGLLGAGLVGMGVASLCCCCVKGVDH